MDVNQFVDSWKIKCDLEGWDFTYEIVGDGNVYVNCPYCVTRSKNQTPDRDLSLTINPTKEMAGKPTGCFNCYRCKNPATRGWGMHWLLGEQFREGNMPAPKPKTLLDLKPTKRNYVAEIGSVIPVMSLPADHIAKQILLRDQFTEEDVTQIAKEFGLLYCVSGAYIGGRSNSTTHRLVIPIDRLTRGANGALQHEIIGWQARWLPPSNRPDLIVEANEKAYLRDSDMKKYIISPGFDRNNLYNYGRVALQRERVYVFEGAKKAWKIPDQSVAHFGVGSLGTEMKLWGPKLAIFKEIVLCYDRDAYDQAVINAGKISEMIDEQTQLCIALKLPKIGPGDMDKYPAAIIAALAEKQLAQARQ